MADRFPQEEKGPVPPPPPYGGTANYQQAPPFANPMYMGTQTVPYGTSPVSCTCPNCGQMIITRVEKKNGLLTWLICGGIILFGGWCGCCLIPFCIDEVKDTEHYCPSCGSLLGEQKSL